MTELVQTTIALMRSGWPGQTDAQLAFNVLASSGYVIFADAWRHPTRPPVQLDVPLEEAVRACLVAAGARLSVTVDTVRGHGAPRLV